jgi:pimeloyl-ACP methyl ester carboxylesterase
VTPPCYGRARRMIALFITAILAALYAGVILEVRVPTLVIHGDSDELIPYEMGQEIAAAIAGAHLITVPGGHHNDLFARDGDRILAAVIEHARMNPEPN